jgi:hypothetical protein
MNVWTGSMQLHDQSLQTPGSLLNDANDIHMSCSSGTTELHACWHREDAEPRDKITVYEGEVHYKAHSEDSMSHRWQGTERFCSETSTLKETAPSTAYGPGESWLSSLVYAWSHMYCEQLLSKETREDRSLGRSGFVATAERVARQKPRLITLWHPSRSTRPAAPPLKKGHIYATTATSMNIEDTYQLDLQRTTLRRVHSELKS